MSGIAEIKHRISSVRDTKKITNAMYLIASTKVRKAKADLERTRPYFATRDRPYVPRRRGRGEHLFRARREED